MVVLPRLNIRHLYSRIGHQPAVLHPSMVVRLPMGVPRSTAICNASDAGTQTTFDGVKWLRMIGKFRAQR
jgi:hypothetical protein